MATPERLDHGISGQLRFFFLFLHLVSFISCSICTSEEEHRHHLAASYQGRCNHATSVPGADDVIILDASAGPASAPAASAGAVSAGSALLPGSSKSRENRSGLQLTALPAEVFQDSGDGDFTDLVPRIIANHKIRRLAEQQQQQEQRLRQRLGETTGAAGEAKLSSRGEKEGEEGGGRGGERGMADDVVLLTSSW